MTAAIAPRQQHEVLRGADPKVILASYLDGLDSSQIAKQLGITRQALSQWLLRNAEADWKAAQHIMAEERKHVANDSLAKAMQDLEACTDPDNTPIYLARVRACEAALKSAQWDLERVCRRIYGADQPPDMTGKVSISINLGVVGEPQIAPQHGDSGGIVIEHNQQVIDKYGIAALR